MLQIDIRVVAEVGLLRLSHQLVDDWSFSARLPLHIDVETVILILAAYVRHKLRVYESVFRQFTNHPVGIARLFLLKICKALCLSDRRVEVVVCVL